LPRIPSSGEPHPGGSDPLRNRPTPGTVRSLGARCGADHGATEGDMTIPEQSPLLQPADGNDDIEMIDHTEDENDQTALIR
jgi:hypothetical protein